MTSKTATILMTGMLIAVSSGCGLFQGPGADWRVGMAKVKITPEKPIRMAGYASRTQPHESVASDLYAKAMALEDGDGNRAVVITADVIGFPNELSEAICKRLQAATGVKREAVLISGSHTHAGPLVTPRLGYALTEAEEKRVVDYGKMLEDEAVAIAQQALANLEPARLMWGTGVADFVMNRREFTERGIILGVNPRGAADRGVPVLRVEDAGGELLAALFGAACHCTTLTGGNLSIDGDYAGHAQAYVEEKHPGAQAMFIPGCGADANPYPRGTLELANRHGESLGAEVVRVLDTELKPVEGPIRTEFRRVDLPLQKMTRAQIEKLAEGAPSYRRYFTDGALAILARGEKLAEHYSAPFALWQFGDDLTLVAYSGETLVDYVALTEQALGPLKLWVTGYSNDLYGYLPSARVIAEGGYESRGMYTDIGLFTPEVQDVVMAAITEMAQAAGRPVQ